MLRCNNGDDLAIPSSSSSFGWISNDIASKKLHHILFSLLLGAGRGCSSCDNSCSARHVSKSVERKKELVEFRYINTAVEFSFYRNSSRFGDLVVGFFFCFRCQLIVAQMKGNGLAFINAYSKIALRGVSHAETPGAFKSSMHPPHVTLVT